jgi:hypothetical protein
MVEENTHDNVVSLSKRAAARHPRFASRVLPRNDRIQALEGAFSSHSKLYRHRTLIEVFSHRHRDLAKDCLV